MHIYFSGIGGAGIGPLALIAHQAGYEVSGSDRQPNLYIDYLKKLGIKNIHLGQSYSQIAEVHHEKPIDWLIYSSAITKEQSRPDELKFCADQGIRTSKRDEFISQFLQDHQLKMLAIAGTHGKTTTTAMMIWLFKQLNIPVSYSVGAKLSFGEMGEFNPKSEYFIYEADEYDRNFLSFHPFLSVITGIDWDHPDIFPTQDSYDQAFQQFLSQSHWKVMWRSDLGRLNLKPSSHLAVLNKQDPNINSALHLAGQVNRQNAWQVAQSVSQIVSKPPEQLLAILNNFPGLARRFEKINEHIYSDYAHTPPKIRGALEMAKEVADNNVVVVYEGLHNTRQHFIKNDLYNLFDNVKQLYIVPSYLAREDPSLPLLSPADLLTLLSPASQKHSSAAELDSHLANAIKQHATQGDTVVCLSAGGGNSLDEWLRQI